MASGPSATASTPSHGQSKWYANSESARLPSAVCIGRGRAITLVPADKPHGGRTACHTPAAGTLAR